jgi:peroxiredoxin
LRRWEELRDEFDARGIQVVTISTDHPEEIREYGHEHGLDAIMLADPQLEITDAFGLRNQGYHSAPPGDDAPGLPVPTSLLVDREGMVLWIDKSENYQRRSGPEVVLAAMQTHLD